MGAIGTYEAIGTSIGPIKIEKGGKRGIELRTSGPKSFVATNRTAQFVSLHLNRLRFIFFK